MDSHQSYQAQEDADLRRQRDMAGLAKAKKMEKSREYVYVRVDHQTVKMIEKKRYERIYKNNQLNLIHHEDKNL